MRAVLCNAFTGPEDLRIGDIEEPKPVSDEILIDVHAASVSFMDHLLVSGRYQMRPSTPFVPGTEAAGVVIAVGGKITRFQPGDRVACWNWTGGYAERMIAKEWKSVRLPVGVAFETAATVWHNYGTAYYALIKGARAQHGETVFVTGAAGGSGARLWCLRCHQLSERRPARADQVDHRRRRRRCLLRQRRRNDFRANGTTDEVGWTVDADRLHERPDSFGADEPSAIEELFHCWGLCRRLDREIPRAGCAHE
jgi:hypothetical protein